MSEKQHKKIRQLYRRNFHHLMENEAEKIINERIVKPKPKWMPRFIYRKLRKLLLYEPR